MHTITLKTDDQLYKQMILMTEELQLSNSELIKRALSSYQETR